MRYWYCRCAKMVLKDMVGGRACRTNESGGGEYITEQNRRTGLLQGGGAGVTPFQRQEACGNNRGVRGSAEDCSNGVDFSCRIISQAVRKRYKLVQARGKSARAWTREALVYPSGDSDSSCNMQLMPARFDARGNKRFSLSANHLHLA